jgi:GTP-binding protein HflX
VVDLTRHNAAEQCQSVEDILADLNLVDKPRITALNKIDLLWNNNESWDEDKAINYLPDQCETVDKNTVFISAEKGWGLTKLLELISHTITKTAQPG